jgi:hypothetical protein
MASSDTVSLSYLPAGRALSLVGTATAPSRRVTSTALSASCTVNILHNSKAHSPPSEAINGLVGEEIPYLLQQTSKDHKSPTLNLTLSRVKSIHILTSHFCKIHFSSILPPNVVVEWLALFSVFWMSRLQISARRPAILTEVSPGFLQSLQANSGIVP